MFIMREEAKSNVACNVEKIDTQLINSIFKKFKFNYLFLNHCRKLRCGAKAVQISKPMRDHQPNPDLFQKVNLFLDRAMTQEDEVSFRYEMHNNPAVTEALHHEQSFRDLLKNSVNRRKASPSLIQSIKDNIRKAPM